MENENTIADHTRATLEIGESDQGSEKLETEIPDEQLPVYPWHLSPKAYFLICSSCMFLTLSFTVSTMSVYELQYSNYLYSFYALLSIRLGIFVYPFILWLTESMIHNSQVKIYMTINLICTLWIATIAIIFPQNKVAFYSILVAQHIGYSFCLGGLIRIREMLQYYDPNCLPFYFTSLQLMTVFQTFLGIPFRALEVQAKTQIFVQVAIAVLIFLYAFILQVSMSNTGYYKLKAADLQKQGEKNTLGDYWEEFKKIYFYWMIIFLSIVGLSLVFPAMTNTLAPPQISQTTWSNISTVIGYGMYVVGNFYKSNRLSTDVVQCSLAAVSVAASVVTCLIYSKRFGNNWMDGFQWVLGLVCLIFINFQVGYYLPYSMRQVIAITKHKASQTLVSSAMSTAYTVGTFIAVGIAELIKR